MTNKKMKSSVSDEMESRRNPGDIDIRNKIKTLTLDRSDLYFFPSLFIRGRSLK